MDGKKLIFENRTYFSERYKEATEKQKRMMGFGFFSAKEAFYELLESEKYEILPLCLFLINFGVGVTKDESFAQGALERLAINDGIIKDSISAYLYAYCLNRNYRVDIKLSENLLEKLIEIKFLPAIVTSGDRSLVEGSLNEALENYKTARLKGCKVIDGKYYKLRIKNSNILEKIVLWASWMFCSLIRVPQMVFSGFKGVEFMYLDFYGIKGIKPRPL